MDTRQVTRFVEKNTGACYGAYHLCFYKKPDGEAIWEGSVTCQRLDGGVVIAFQYDGDEYAPKDLADGMQLYSGEDVPLKDLNGSYVLMHGTYKLKVSGVSLLEFEEVEEGRFKYTAYETEDYVCCMSRWVVSFANSSAALKPWPTVTA